MVMYDYLLMLFTTCLSSDHGVFFRGILLHTIMYSTMTYLISIIKNNMNISAPKKSKKFTYCKKYIV